MSEISTDDVTMVDGVLDGWVLFSVQLPTGGTAAVIATKDNAEAQQGSIGIESRIARAVGDLAQATSWPVAAGRLVAPQELTMLGELRPRPDLVVLVDQAMRRQSGG